MKNYADYVYDIVKEQTEKFDAIYEDYITELVGVFGLNALLDNNLLETCGIVNGKQLYVLCDNA